MAWSHGKPYAEACGVPAPATYDPDDPFNPIYEDPYGCSNTVQIGSTCWLSGTPNYGTFGIMMRLCYDDIGMQLLLGSLGGISREALLGLAPTIALAGGYKAGKGDQSFDPTAWAAATWAGSPGGQLSVGNSGECECTCPHPGPSGVFDYIW